MQKLDCKQVVQAGSFGDIVRVSKNKKKVRGLNLTETEIAFVTREAVQALHYMHSLKLLHRDFKGLNLMLNKYGQVKICILYCETSNSNS